LGKYTKWHGDLKILMDLFKIDKLYRYFKFIESDGFRKVMNMIIKIMPTLLQEWKHDNRKMYEMGTIFQVQFCIHLLVDVLIELNKLSQ